MAGHNELGKSGEDKAVAYLMQEGYVVLERNWRLGHKELDVVCMKDDMSHAGGSVSLWWA